MNRKTQRAAPNFAAGQISHILQLLREAKARGRGVRKRDLLFEHHYTQASARIHELEAAGYVIRHETEPGERYVTFYLLLEPERATSADQAPLSPEKSPSLFSQGTLPLCAALEGRE